MVGIPLAVISGFITLTRWFDQRVEDSRSGPLHTYQIRPVPQFLTDDLAVAKARQTLALDGYDVSVWQPSEDDRSKAPDGTPDVYLVRNTINPNRGFIEFLDTNRTDRNPSRIVTVELKGEHVECQVLLPK